MPKPKEPKKPKPKVLQHVPSKREEFLINGRRLLPIDQTAHYLGISKRTLYGWGSKNGSKVPKPKRFGKKLLWDAGELREFVESLGN